MHVTDGAARIHQAKQNGRGDVVGQVAHHPQRSALPAQRLEVEFERIHLVHAKRVRVKARAKLCRQIPVQLDHVETSGGLEQLAGERAETRTDLHHRFTGLRGYRADNAVDNRSFVEKMLPEAPPGAMRGLAHVPPGRDRARIEAA